MSLTTTNLINQLINGKQADNRNNGNQNTGRMPIEVIKKRNEYLITAELPGFENNEVEIEVSPDSVSITAEHETGNNDEGEDLEDNNEEELKVIYSEIRNKKLKREITFDRTLNPSEASSTMKNGILNITLPVIPEEQPTKIKPIVEEN